MLSLWRPMWLHRRKEQMVDLGRESELLQSDYSIEYTGLEARILGKQESEMVRELLRYYRVGGGT